MGDQRMRDLLRSSLEEARLEIVRRLECAGLPTSRTVERPVLEDTENGVTTGSVPFRVSAVTDPAIHRVVGKKEPGLRGLGVSEQLASLAEAYYAETALGAVTHPFGSGEEGSEYIVNTFLEPLAFEYLRRLEDIARPDEGLVDRLGDELDELAARGRWVIHGQLALDGVHVDEVHGPYEGVVLRPLSPTERGAAFAGSYPFRRDEELVEGFVVPVRFDMFVPRVLLEWEEAVGKGMVGVRRFASRLALAFFLRGHEITSPGSYVQFCHPRWAYPAQHPTAIPVQSKVLATGPSHVDRGEFCEVVDLASSMPDFDEERTSHQVALGRALRGFGAANPDFLDLAIALEAALLPGGHDQLRYKFALYGALYLGEPDPGKTFSDLRTIYDVRSRLAHGATSAPDGLDEALGNARRLLLAVLAKAVPDDWPTQKALDALAYTRGPA